MKTMRREGFTLVELLVMIVTLAVLAAIAIPLYNTTIEKSRKAEAVRILSGLRASELRYFNQNNRFTPDLTELDYIPDTNANSPQTHHFDYCISLADTAAFTASAFRNITDTRGLQNQRQALIQIDQRGLVRESPGPGTFRMGPGGNMIIVTGGPSTRVPEGRWSQLCQGSPSSVSGT